MNPDERPHHAGTSAAHAHPPVRLLWWLYFVLIALDCLGTVLRVHSVLDGVQLAFWALGLVGLWGYLRPVRILARRFWMAYLGLFVLWIVFNIAVLFGRHPDAGLMPSLAASLVLALVCGPQVWALWCYVFRSPRVWRAAATPTRASP